jgi:transketolase
MRDGTDVAIIANGLMVYEAMKAGEELEKAGINARIINMSTIKPLDEELVLKCAKECGKIITCEEHSVIGGLGEAVCSFLSENYPTPVRRIGVDDQFGFSGPAAEVLEHFGLCASNIVKTAKEFLGK